MTSRVTPTLALCLAGGLAAGIALARPGDSPAPAPAPVAAVAAEAPVQTDAYGSEAPTAEAPAAAAPAAAQVQIADFAFGAPAQIGAGGELVVTNVDSAPHTLTAVDGSFDTGTIDGGGNAVAIVAPSAPGTYEFFCAIHPSMTGQLVVS